MVTTQQIENLTNSLNGLNGDFEKYKAAFEVSFRKFNLLSEEAKQEKEAADSRVSAAYQLIQEVRPLLADNPINTELLTTKLNALKVSLSAINRSYDTKAGSSRTVSDQYGEYDSEVVFSHASLDAVDAALTQIEIALTTLANSPRVPVVEKEPTAEERAEKQRQQEEARKARAESDARAAARKAQLDAERAEYERKAKFFKPGEANEKFAGVIKKYNTMLVKSLNDSFNDQFDNLRYKFDSKINGKSGWSIGEELPTISVHPFKYTYINKINAILNSGKNLPEIRIALDTFQESVVKKATTGKVVGQLGKNEKKVIEGILTNLIAEVDATINNQNKKIYKIADLELLQKLNAVKRSPLVEESVKKSVLALKEQLDSILQPNPFEKINLDNPNHTLKELAMQVWVLSEMQPKFINPPKSEIEQYNLLIKTRAQIKNLAIQLSNQVLTPIKAVENNNNNNNNINIVNEKIQQASANLFAEIAVMIKYAATKVPVLKNVLTENFSEWRVDPKDPQSIVTFLEGEIKDLIVENKALKYTQEETRPSNSHEGYDTEVYTYNENLLVDFIQVLTSYKKQFSALTALTDDDLSKVASKEHIVNDADLHWIKIGLKTGHLQRLATEFEDDKVSDAVIQNIRDRIVKANSLDELKTQLLEVKAAIALMPAFHPSRYDGVNVPLLSPENRERALVWVNDILKTLEQDPIQLSNNGAKNVAENNSLLLNNKGNASIIDDNTFEL